MPRKELIRTNDFPYHITARTNNKDWFYVSMDECWAIFSKYLNRISEIYHVKIIAFVLMSNHFHLLLNTPLANIDKAMNYLLREVSKRIGEKSNRINHVFGGPYFWNIIDRNQYYHHVYKYVYRNPVDHGVVSQVEEYQYSTLVHPKIDFRFYDLDLFPCDLIPSDRAARLDWLNTSFKDKQLEVIEKGLKRTRFSLTKDNNYKTTVQDLILTP